MDFAVLVDNRVKIKENQKTDMYLGLARELKKTTMEYEGDGDTNCNRYAWNNLQRFGKETRRFRNHRTSRDHPDYSINKIGQNIEKSPRDFLFLKLQ